MTMQAIWFKNVNAAETLKDKFTQCSVDQSIRYWKAGPEVTSAILTQREEAIAIGDQIDALAEQQNVSLMYKSSRNEFRFFIEYAEDEDQDPKGWWRGGSSDGSYWVESLDEVVQNKFNELAREADRIDINNAVSRAVYGIAPPNERMPSYLFAVMRDMKSQIIGNEVYFVTNKPKQEDYDFFKRANMDFPESIPGCIEIRASEYYAALEKQQQIAKADSASAPAPE